MKKDSWNIGACLCACALLWQTEANAEEARGSLGSTLRALFAESPAFRAPEVKAREAAAAHLESSGAFDLVASAALQGQRSLWSAPFGGLTDQGYNDLSVQTGLWTRTRENLTVQVTGSTPLTSSIDPSQSPDQPQISANLVVPLLKLGHAAAYGAAERAAWLHATASAELQQDSESDLAARVASAYWRWSASYEQLKLTRRLETLAADQLKDVEQLVIQHARAQVDRLPFAAAAENATATAAQAERAMFEEQQAVWEALGSRPIAEVVLPSEALPEPPATPADVASLAAHARRMSAGRPLFAFLEREASAAAVHADATGIAVRPDVNLVGQGTAARVERYADATQTVAGYYGGVALQFSMPLQNRAARGAHERAVEQRAARQIEAAIGQNVVEARIDALCNTLATLSRTYAERVRAAEEYRLAYEAERAKFRAGTATGMDVVVAEQQLMASSLAVLAERTSYAVALAQLLHETGALNGPVHARDAVAVVRRLTTSNL